MNRIEQLFKTKKNNILSIYFTAGHPTLDSTVEIIKTLVEEGTDLIEIGIPFSDPIADGPVIQKSSQTSLENGMSLKLLFEHIKDIRKDVNIPLILMGYLNPVLQYGIETFCKKCNDVGIDGTILPDLPFDIYQEEYESIFDKHNIYNIFLITPQTNDERIRKIDNASKGFIYMVAASATTGIRQGFEEYQQDYFIRIEKLGLKHPRLIGFGISSRETFQHACKYANGAIIGSAFVSALEEASDLKKGVQGFIRNIQ
ncbi:MAG: tryptophan synthase subunit alpha [Bacteroidales bacterium]|nr:tryptophan synthase subunit alpha [Bacteroidales bacterium]